MRRYITSLGFIVFVLLVGFAFQTLEGNANDAVRDESRRSNQALYMTQLASCARGNLLRDENNKRVIQNGVQKKVLADFIRTAKIARRAAGSPTDLKAAREYEKYGERLSSVKYSKIEQVNCKKIIPRP